MFEEITLEVSLKPFKKTDESYIRTVCKKICEDWRALVSDASCVCVLFWAADGSEILDFRGNLDDSFEWAYWIGTGNQNPAFSFFKPEIDPDKSDIHSQGHPYIDSPPVMTYRIFQNIIRIMRKTLTEAFPEKSVKIGAAFDPGPEFARSDFKYQRHPEICMGSDMGENSMVCSYSRLHADSLSYAGFPDGIPEGLPFGTFFGRQAECYLKALGFDYLWLSNGFGFGRDTWSDQGAIFDSKKFHTERLSEIKQEVYDFWTLFRKECPDFPVETRGTNMTAGIDYSTDGVPLDQIYRGNFNLLPPPNSPWAALNQDFGLELAGYLSRICELPENQYLYRFYLHDPWWLNSPWYDRYYRYPHDIYLPLSLARIDENGNVQSPTHLNLLTIDNAYGNMPKTCINEIIPHLRQAKKDAPDTIPPIVWVYPFPEYMSAETPEELSKMYYEDWFLCSAINRGLPVSAVVSSGYFCRQDFSLYCASVLIAPVPKPESRIEARMLAYAESGGNILFYGNPSHAGKQFLSFFSSEKHVRKQKNAVWICTSDSRNAETEEAAHSLLSEFGYQLSFDRCKPDSPAPVLSISRHDQAFIFSAFLPDTTVGIRIKLPLGAPVLDGYETQLEDGFALWRFPKALHAECRIFVRQDEGIISCHEHPPVDYYYRRKIKVSGLLHADLYFFPEHSGSVYAYEKHETDGIWHMTHYEPEWLNLPEGCCCKFTNVSGTVIFALPSDKNKDCKHYPTGE